MKLFSTNIKFVKSDLFPEINLHVWSSTVKKGWEIGTSVRVQSDDVWINMRDQMRNEILN